MIDVDITGTREIEALLSNLTKVEIGKIARNVTRETNEQVVLPTAVENAISIGGQMGREIARSLTIRAMTRLKKGNYGTRIILKPNVLFDHNTADGKRYYIPAAIEYGHAYPGRGGGGDSPKDVAPIPFMRPTYETRRSPAATYAAQMLKKQIEGYVNSKRKR